MRGGLVHGHNISEGRVYLNIRVTGAEDIAAVLAQAINQAAGLVGHLLGRALAQDFLEIQAAVKAQMAAEILFQAGGVHARGAGLDRLQHVHAGFNDHGQKRPHGTE